MSAAPEACPKCDSEMEQGFILDTNNAGRMVSSWAPGAPVESFWLGTKRTEDPTIPIGVFRCVSCGFLEAYARDEFAAK